MLTELAILEVAKTKQADLIAEAQRYHRRAAARRRARAEADLGSRSPVRAGPRLPHQRQHQEAPAEQRVA